MSEAGSRFWPVNTIVSLMHGSFCKIFFSTYLTPYQIYNTNCGVFTPFKNCSIETRSRDYATVDEAVFPPWRAKQNRAEPWRVAHRLVSSSITSHRLASPLIASHRLASPRLVCCQATAINTWMTQEWRGVTWPRQQWLHAFQQWRNNWSTVGRSVSRVSDQGFIGETEARLRVSSRWEIAGGSSWVVSSHPVKTLIVSVLRAVARRRLGKTKNPSAYATVNWKVCKWAITLYCLYISVFRCECVTQLLTNPIIRTRTRHFSGVYHHTRHNIII
jgi:hypothetical protein